MTSIFSIFGECSGNVRSTPTPNDCLRTVKVSRALLPCRLITTPSNTCVRRRLPSTTWKWTFTRSPALNRGTLLSCARSRLSITPLIAKNVRGSHGERPARAGADGSEGPSPLRRRESPLRQCANGRPSARPLGPALGAPRAPPRLDVGVMAGQEHLRHAVPAPLDRTRVVRVLGRAAERLAERLLDRALGVPERARKLADHRVADDHRRELSARQDVGPDRHDVAREVLVHPLVESLVATAEKDDFAAATQAAGELLRERVVEPPASGRERDHPPALAQPHRVLVVALAQRRLDHIHPHDHPRAPAVRRVVNLAGTKRRGLPEVER